MKPVLKVASMIMAILFVFSSIPSALLESAPEATEKPVMEVSPLPGGILKGPGTGDWKLPKGDAAVKGENPYPSSPHPYTNDMDVYYSYQEPDAIGYVITFSSSTFVEEGYDFIYFFDEDRNQLSFNISGDVFYRFTGNQLAGKTMLIESPEFFTNLTSDDSNTEYGFSYSSIIPVYPTSNTTTIIYTCEQSGPDSVKLVWNKLNGTDGYLVYRGTGGAATEVADTTETNYEDSLPPGCEGVTYYYTVQPYYMDGLNRNLYAVSGEQFVKMMAIPEIVMAVAINASTAYIDWKTVPDADGYYLYRSDTGVDPFNRVKSVTNSYTTNGTGGTSWYYKVKPYRTYSTNVDGSLSDSSAEVSYTALALDEVWQSGPTTAKIKWTPVSGATGYTLYRNLTATGTYSSIKSMEDLTPSSGQVSTTNSGLIPGTQYFYKVRAYTTVGGTKIYGAYTAPLDVTILARPEVNYAHRVGNTATIRWSAPITNAAGYTLYRATSASGTYYFIKNIVGGGVLETKNYNLTSGKTYYYKVAAYRLYGPDKVTGAQSFYMKLH